MRILDNVSEAQPVPPPPLVSPHSDSRVNMGVRGRHLDVFVGAEGWLFRRAGL